MIKEYRETHKISLSQLSKLTGIPTSTISDIEHGKYKNSKAKGKLYDYISLHMVSKDVCQRYQQADGLFKDSVVRGAEPKKKLWRTIKE